MKPIILVFTIVLVYMQLEIHLLQSDINKLVTEYNNVQKEEKVAFSKIENWSEAVSKTVNIHTKVLKSQLREKHVCLSYPTEIAER